MKYMTSTFDPRDLPVAIIIEDGPSTLPGVGSLTIVGPFCRHCGETQDHHDNAGHCPQQLRPLLPAPSCTCHAETRGKPPKVGERVRTNRGWATMVAPNKARGGDGAA